jgi:hypothetical protein
MWHDGSLQLDGLCRGNGASYLHFLEPLPPGAPRTRLSQLGQDLRTRRVAFTDLGSEDPDSATSRIVETVAATIAAR